MQHEMRSCAPIFTTSWKTKRVLSVNEHCVLMSAHHRAFSYRGRKSSSSSAKRLCCKMSVVFILSFFSFKVSNGERDGEWVIVHSNGHSDVSREPAGKCCKNE